MHHGADRRDNLQKTRDYSENLFATNNFGTPNDFTKLEAHLKQGIAVNEVGHNDWLTMIHRLAPYDKVGKPTMLMVIYNRHAFLITDIDKVTRSFACGECNAKFTRSWLLNRHKKHAMVLKPNLSATGVVCMHQKQTSKKHSFPAPFIPLGPDMTALCRSSNQSRFIRVDKVQKHIKTKCFRAAYTGLPVVRVTENQKALNCVACEQALSLRWERMRVCSHPSEV